MRSNDGSNLEVNDGITNSEEVNSSKDYRTNFRLRLLLIILTNFCLLFLISTAVMATLHFRNQAWLACEKNSEPSKPSLSLLGKYTRAAVAADNVFCSEIGRNILLKGGNAIDASIATLFCIGVMDPQSAGVGGGSFMTVYNATTKTCYVIDARETAPLAASENMFADRSNLSVKGWLSIATPGEIHGYWTAYKAFGGKLKWNQLVEPTIELMKTGYPTSRSLANALKVLDFMIYSEPTMKVFINPATGRLYDIREKINTRSALMEFLKRLASASDAVQFFYNSSLTYSLVEEIQRNGGILTVEDFQLYQSKLFTGNDVLYSELSDGYRICGAPPPAGSAAAMSIISVPDKFFAEHDKLNVDPVEVLHRFIETSKFAYAARSKLSDPAFNPESLLLAKQIVSRSYAAQIKKLITDRAHSDSYYGGDFDQIDDHGTSHLSVIDTEGNAVSATSTVNILLGAGVVSPATGILWNDEMDDFSIPNQDNFFGFTPSKKNYIKAGKRPMSSSSPIIIFNSEKKDLFPVGGAGGSKIITGTAYVVMRTLWLNESLKVSIDSPRVHNQLTPNSVLYELDLPQEYIQKLQNKGHKMEPTYNLSIIIAAKQTDEDVVYANCDYRKGEESIPAGF